MTSTTQGRKIGAGRRIGFVLIAAFVIYFAYNMLPNVFSSILPGGKSGVSGEWVGMVQYKPDMMSDTQQPAVIKVSLSATDMTSIIPTYKMVGEITISGKGTPLTFTVDKMMTGHEIKTLDGQVTESSMDGLKGGILNGDIKDGQMNIHLNGMSAGNSAELEGSLHKGSDSDYITLTKQVQQ